MSTPDKLYVGQALKSLHTSPDWGEYSKVILRVEDDMGYVSGDDTGMTLEAECPWASQEIADNVLAALGGVSYRPYDGAGVIIHPAVELGDAITAAGFYSGIYTLSRRFSKLAAPDISAPCDTEVSHELQYESQTDRRFVRMSQKISTEFAILADRMVAKVSGEHSSFGWEMLEDGMTWWANGQKVMEANASGLKLTGTLEAGVVLTGTLNVGGTDISAATLRQGASDGYSWGSGGGAYEGYSSKSAFSLAGSGFGINFNNATRSNSSYPNYFQTNNTIVTGHFSGNSIQVRTLTIEHNYTFKQVYVKSDGTLAVQV